MVNASSCAPSCAPSAGSRPRVIRITDSFADIEALTEAHWEDLREARRVMKKRRARRQQNKKVTLALKDLLAVVDLGWAGVEKTLGNTAAAHQRKLLKEPLKPGFEDDLIKGDGRQWVDAVLDAME